MATSSTSLSYNSVKEYLHELRMHIGIEWKTLARELGFSTTDRDAIQHDYMLSLKEQIYQFTHKWEMMEGDDASIEKLRAGLQRADLLEVLLTVEQNHKLRSDMRDKRLQRLGSSGSDATTPSPTWLLEVGDAVIVKRVDAAPWYGVIKYLGDLSGTGKMIAGMDLDVIEGVPGGTDGEYEGVRYFKCEDGHGLFLPVDLIARDDRFDSPVPSPADQESFDRDMMEKMAKEREEKRHLSAFRAVMTKKGKLKQTILHCLLFGYPGTGKSSLLKWITGQRLSPHLPSTGVVEKAIVVEIRRISTSTTMVQHSESQHGSAASPWRILSINEEALALMASAVQSSDNPVSTTPTPSLALAIEKDTTGDSSYVQSQSQPMDFLKKAMEYEGPERIQQFQQLLQDSLTLYLTDTGGQLEFQELLPALTAGPIIFFLFFRLDQDLSETVNIEYRYPGDDSTELYQSSLTVKQMLQQALASIASMGTHMDKYSVEDVPLKPSVIFIGTHRDKVSPEEIKRIDRNLQEMVTATSFALGLVEPASKSQLAVVVNNLSPEDSDFHCIQSVVERITDRDNFNVSLPSTWLIFSLLLRQQKRRVITYSDCFNIAQKCGIDSQEELNEALWFLNTKVGLVRYFQGEGLEDLQQIVIIDPQVIFDKLTRLIVNTFTFHNARANVRDEFKSKGIFPLSAVERIWRKDDDDDKLLTVDRFIRLLEHLHIISRLQHTTEIKYFMPCTLVHAQSKAFAASSTVKARQVPPLLLTFECGYCPMGLFSALIVYLLANKMKSHFDWTLKKPYCISRNAISLYIPPYDTITLTVLPTYLEVAIFPAEVEIKRKRTVEAVCREVRRCIEIAVQEVASTLHYTSGADHSLAFYCTGKHEAKQEPHAAKVFYVEGSPSPTVLCEMGAVCNFPRGHDLWFNKERPCPQQSMGDYEAKISPAKRRFVVNTPTQIADIAKEMKTWESVSHRLVSDAKAEEIRKNNATDYLEQKKRAIKTWSDGLGHEATYVALMRIFYEDKNIRMVEKLIEQLDALE